MTLQSIHSIFKFQFCSFKATSFFLSIPLVSFPPWKIEFHLANHRQPCTTVVSEVTVWLARCGCPTLYWVKVNAGRKKKEKKMPIVPLCGSLTTYEALTGVFRGRAAMTLVDSCAGREWGCGSQVGHGVPKPSPLYALALLYT
jgi:hypothetical protein